MAEEERTDVTEALAEATDTTDGTTRVVGSSIDPVRARLSLAYWVLGVVVILLFAAVLLRVWPYPDCDPICTAEQISYMVEGREAAFAFATTFLPSVVTLVLGYWFRDRQITDSY